MIICCTIEEFLFEIIERKTLFEEIEFSDSKLYSELYYHIINKLNNRLDNVIYILLIGNLLFTGKGVRKDHSRAFEYFKKATYLNNSEAMWRLGLCYKYGLGCEKDLKMSFKLYNQSALKENPQGMWHLAHSYKYGVGCRKSYKKAFYWYEQSAKLGYSNAMNSLAICYEEGLGVKKTYEKAFYWYNCAAKLENKEAMFSLGYYYKNGLAIEIDLEKSFYWYEQSALAGYSDAMWQLGVYYEEGIGVEKNPKKAFEWYKNSALDNNDVGMWKLSLCYINGVGTNRNPEKALNWCERSAKKGNASAIWSLGVFYEDGYLQEQSFEKAFDYYHQASLLGNSSAMLALGRMYEEGKGCEKNSQSSIEWYLKSAKAGNTSALFKIAEYYYNNESYDVAIEYCEKAKKYNLSAYTILAECYEHGRKCEQNYEKAFKYYKLAAENGDIKAMRQLGNLYEQGKGCNQNYKLALNWYELSLSKGNEYAREDVERVKCLLEEQSKKSRLVFSSRKDVFISWNHYDKDIKDDICKNLEERKILTVWESDGNGVGDINENIKNAILSSRSYIVILTGNSISSKWVEKEISLILEKINSDKNYENVIRPIIIDRKMNPYAKKMQYFDVVKGINKLSENSPFRKLLDYCASFEDYEIGINYDHISSFLCEAISNSLKIEYKNRIIKKYESFSAALNTVVSSRDTKTGIIAATLEFESGYLNRYIYDKDNNQIKPQQLLSYNTPSLIYGEGGTGKSLYLKNFIRNEFKDNKYIFYLECRRIKNFDEEFIVNLKTYGFDSYLEGDLGKQVSLYSFKQIFNFKNETIVLIDALDEISLENRKKLIEQINIFYQQYKSKIIFTSRNKTDASIINSIFNIKTTRYELRGLELFDIEKLYETLSLQYQSKESSTLVFDPIKLKDIFFTKLLDISEDIKKNPLLISNLIFIYFATHKIPDTSFDIINESVLILINDLEEERSLDFEYNEYLKDEKINKILGYLALQRSYNNTNPAEVIIKEYLEENYENIDYSKIADEIYKYLRRRAIIVNENISHEIFKNYFASSYIFLEMYKKKSNIAKKKYFELTEEGREFLKSLCSDEFQKDDETWNNIAIDLLYKLDFEIFNLDPKKIMDNNHLSYNAFDTTLIKTLTEKGFNQTIISIIINILEKISFHYNEFIRQYIKK